MSYLTFTAWVFSLYLLEQIDDSGLASHLSEVEEQLNEMCYSVLQLQTQQQQPAAR